MNIKIKLTKKEFLEIWNLFPCYFLEYGNDIEEMLSINEKELNSMLKSLSKMILKLTNFDNEEEFEFSKKDFNVLVRMISIAPCNDFNNLEKECFFSNNLNEKIHKIFKNLKK